MKILYFSWIKDKIGKNFDDIKINDNVKTIKDLIVFLQGIDDNYKNTFEDTSSIRVSINMETAKFEDKINNNDEIAFFPPMTGG